MIARFDISHHIKRLREVTHVFFAMRLATDAVMRPLLLTFRDAALESEFERYAYEQMYRPGDLRFFFVTTIVLFSISIKAVVEQEFRLLPTLPLFGISALTVGMWHVYHASSTQRVLRLRRYMSIIFRSCHLIQEILFERICRICIALVGSVTNDSQKWMFALVPNPVAVTVQFLMATETLGNFPYAFGITLKFEDHLPTHFITYLIFLFGRAPVLCERIVESRGASVFYKIDAVVDAIFEFCYAFLRSTIGVFGETTPPIKIPCLHLSAFLMVFFSAGYVSFALWKSERSARVRFLMTRRRTDRNSFTPLLSDSTSECVSCLILLAMAVLYWRWSVALTTMVLQLT